ncbi:MAG: 4-hydroxythreonine-4-phosphate dehydrogenase PdxA [Alphaproteobacteria bacterium]|nr:4-hydroxythreonine-4-phosphate dehydrogenase PdxA [Alphaproteobacteria bacterium]
MSEAPLLAVTMGEPAGIGPEIALKAHLALAGRPAAPRLLWLADPDLAAATAKRLGIGAQLLVVRSADEARRADGRALAILPHLLARASEPGRPDPANAPAVVAAIETGVALLARGAADALVTNPIAKSVLAAAGFAYSGHTEFLAALAQRHFALAEEPTPVMMLAGPRLRTVPLTLHLPLSEVPAALTEERILEVARIVARSLAGEFGIARPRLVLGGLNPHAGEDGRLGTEEERVLRPAAQKARAEGIDLKGPLAADSLFHEGARGGYDAALLPSHDQALIPVKTLDFEDTVNVTLGLPFVRTSPDHGTAFDIAGTGRASERGLLAAIALAERLAARRR